MERRNEANKGRKDDNVYMALGKDRDMDMEYCSSFNIMYEYFPTPRLMNDERTVLGDEDSKESPNTNGTDAANSHVDNASSDNGNSDDKPRRNSGDSATSGNVGVQKGKQKFGHQRLGDNEADDNRRLFDSEDAI